jgi:hypothetical protein
VFRGVTLLVAAQPRCETELQNRGFLKFRRDSAVTMQNPKNQSFSITDLIRQRLLNIQMVPQLRRHHRSQSTFDRLPRQRPPP